MKEFIHSYPVLLKLQAWNCKSSCASSGIHLLSIFGALGQKVELLLSIFCGTKITLDSPCLPPVIFRSVPPSCLTHPLILKVPPTPHIIQYFEISIPPICNWGVKGVGRVQTMSQLHRLQPRWLIARWLLCSVLQVEVFHPHVTSHYFITSIFREKEVS